MKVLLVDDSVPIQQSFGALLAGAPDVDIVGCAEDVATALASIAVEGFSPALLKEATRATIAKRVDAVLQTMHCPPEPLWPA